MAQTFNSAVPKVAQAYCRLLNIKVTNSSLQKDIEGNPYYPSLLSLSDTFTRYNIANSAYNISTEDFDQLEAPFVAFVNVPSVGSDFVLVTKITQDKISYLYNDDKPKIVEKEQFVKDFKNVVLLAEPDEKSGERDYVSNLKTEKKLQTQKSFMAIGALLVVLFLVVSNITAATVLAYSAMVIVKLVGLSSAVLLLVYEIDKNNVFVKNICSAGARTNCDAVLNSAASKIWGISWTEIGFFYFAFTTLLLLMPGFSFAYKATLLAIANAFAAPYILFSLYYQMRIVKQWCPLCLTVQAVLVTELIWSIIYFWVPVHSLSSLTGAGLTLVAGVISLALLPLVGWYGLKPYLIKAKDHNLYKSAYKRLQYNPEIFNSLLMQQAQAADNWQQIGITIGNPDAPNTIIKVCNPYCGPCARMHPKLEEIIANNNNVNLKVIFTARNSETDRGAPVVKHLLAIAAQGNAEKTQQAMDDWYLPEQKSYDALAAKYPMNGELKQQDDKIEAMSAWCNEAEIMHTPTIFVNGFRLPENYDVEELRYIL